MFGHTFRRDALFAGVFYLGLAITGALGFLLVRPALFVPGDPAATLSNLLEKEALARVGIALELGIVLFQALAAVWFGKLFRDVDAFAAGALTLFGLVNAVALLGSATLMHAALNVAQGSSGVTTTTSHLLFFLSGKLWETGMLFFGLWLVPMGWLVLRSGIGSRALGCVLILGGFGYVMNLFIVVLAPDAGAWTAILPLPAAVGEFWTIGLLIWISCRPAWRMHRDAAGKGTSA
jgi:hypothetical protein